MCIFNIVLFSSNLHLNKQYLTTNGKLETRKHSIYASAWFPLAARPAPNDLATYTKSYIEDHLKKDGGLSTCSYLHALLNSHKNDKGEKKKKPHKAKELVAR